MMWSAARTTPIGNPPRTLPRTIAFAEDRAIFDGYREANIQGIREGTSNPIKPFPPMCVTIRMPLRTR